MSHPKHGGARPGSGRKPKEGGYNKLLTMRSNAAELEKFAAIGGARWLHEAIASEYARQSVDAAPEAPDKAQERLPGDACKVMAASVDAAPV